MQKDMQVAIKLQGVDDASAKVKAVNSRIVELTSRVEKARSRLKEIAITQNQIKGFSDLKAKTDAARLALDSARERAQALEKAVSIGEPVKKELGKAAKAVKDLEAQYASLTEKTNKAQESLRRKGIATDQLTQKTRALREEQQRLDKVIDTQRRAEAMRSRAGSMAIGGAAALGAGVGVLGGVGQSVRAYAEAEVAATALKTAMMDSTGAVSADFARMNALANSLGNRLPGATADFQDMMTMLIRQGMPAKTILEGTGEAAAYLGVQLKMAPAQAAEFAAKMQDALRAPSQDMMGVMDVIQRTFYAGVDPTNMLQGFAKASAGMDILRIKGVEGARVIAPLLAMADQSGLVGEASGNALRKVLQLSMNTGKTRGYGLDFTDGRGEHAGLGKMFSELQKLRSMSTEKRLEAIKDIFGNDAETIQMLTLMIEKGQAGYDEMVGKLQQQADLQRRVDSSLGTLSSLWEATEGTWTNVKAAFGETLAPELKSITTLLGEVSAGMQTWITENPGAARAIALVVAGLGVLLTVGGAITLMLAGLLASFATFKLAGLVIFPVLKAAFSGLGTVFMDLLSGLMTVARFLVGGLLAALKSVFAFLIANPIVLVIMAIVGVLYLLYRNWDTVTSFMKSSWEGLVTWLTGIKDRFVQFGSEIWNGLINGLTNGATQAWESLKSGLGGMVEKARNFLGIRSPSRVFAEIGGFTAAGLAMGIAHGTPAVVSTAENMARQVSSVGAPGVGGTGAAAGGVTIGQVSIVIEGSGLDAEAIARAVDQRLRQMATQARTDAQSRFFDDD